MILNTNRMRPPLRQWPFLLLPVMLIGAGTWLVIPAASSQPGPQVGGPRSASNGPLSARSVASTRDQTQIPPAVDKTTIWVDSVKRGALHRQVRGLGVLVAGEDGRLKAAVQIAAPQAKEIRIGQPAAVDTRQGVIPSKVIHISSDDSSGSIAVNLSLEGDVPQSAGAGLNVDGTIEIERLDDVLFVGRPANGQAGGISSLFRLDEGGTTATRVQVRFGKSSVNTIEIIEGLNVGDKVIISDMSAHEGVNTIRLN